MAGDQYYDVGELDLTFERVTKPTVPTAIGIEQ